MLIKLRLYILFQIFEGNTDIYFVVSRHNLDPAIKARYIRVHPGYFTGDLVCMTLELYGCVPRVEQGL